MTEPVQPRPTMLDEALRRRRGRRRDAVDEILTQEKRRLGDLPEGWRQGVENRAASTPAPGVSEADAAVEDLVDAVGGPPTEERVGVVFIHGIGAQRPGETLHSWSKPIIEALSAWNRQQDPPLPADPVVRAQVTGDPSSIPVVEVAVAGGGPGQPDQRWLMTEAYWAARVEPPSYLDILRWLLTRGEFFTIIRGIVDGLNDARTALHGPPSGFGAVLRAVRRLFERVMVTLLFLFLALGVAPVYLALRILRTVPIPWLRVQIDAGQLDWFLSEWFGDVRILLSDRAQAANIRDSVLTAIEALRAADCGPIVVVGHSGGTIVGYLSLAAAGEALGATRFITHGQALGLAWRLGHVGRTDTRWADEALRPGDHLLTPLPDAIRDGWYDYWSTHDPAPSGPFEAQRPQTVSAPPEGQSIRITNRESVVNDHGGYWHNDEQFVIPILRHLDTATRPLETSRFYPEPDRAERRVDRRRRRVQWLGWWWASWMLAVALAVGVGTAAQLRAPAGEGIGADVVNVVGDVARIATLGADDGLVRLGDGFLGAIERLTTLVTPSDCPDGDCPAADPAAPNLWTAGIVAIVALLYVLSMIGVRRWNDWDERERREAFLLDPTWSSDGWRVRALLLMAAQTGAVLLALGWPAPPDPIPGWLALTLIAAVLAWFPGPWLTTLRRGRGGGSAAAPPPPVGSVPSAAPTGPTATPGS